MTAGRSQQESPSSTRRTVPVDLAAIVVLTVALNSAVFIPILRDTPIRVPLGFAFLLFVPGYVLVSTLFPGRSEPAVDAGEEQTEQSDESSRSGITSLERVVLSIGSSVVIVPLLWVLLAETPWGIQLVSTTVAVTIVTLLLALVATVRRWNTPPSERYVVPYRDWMATGRSAVFGYDTRGDAALNVVLAVTVLLAVATTGYAVAVSQDGGGDEFTAVSLLTENDSGELVTGDHPSELENGSSEEIVLGISNNEHRTIDYTVVAIEQDIDTTGNETSVSEQNELERFSTTIDHDTTEYYEFELEPTMTGEDIRFVWAVYVERDVPSEPSGANADNYVDFWATVTESNDE